MRRLAVALASVLALSLPAAAQEAEPLLKDSGGDKAKQAAPLAPPEAPAVRLDKLFGELRRERNEKAAQRLAGRISNEWAHSGSDTVDLMMGWAKQGIDAKKYDVALDFLDQVTVLEPRYAEGWNLRATAHFLMNDYAMSMRDIDRTLQLEPRHFGALAGMAMILRNTDRKEAALAAYERVLAVYPMNRAAQNEVAELSDELAGQGI